MNVELIRVTLDEANELWQAEVAAFQGLYAKYQDHDTSPATEPLEKIIARLEQPFTYYYWIKADGAVVGGIRVVYALGATDWQLETILQEEGNCYLYEKMGYRRTGETEVINERMTLVNYRKL